MFVRSSSILILSLAICIAFSESLNNEGIYKDNSMNTVQEIGRFRSPSEIRGIDKRYTKRKNIRNIDWKQREDKKSIDTAEVRNSSTLPASKQQLGCQCGLANLEPERIIGGEEISPARKYPWLVLIKMRYRQFKGSCSGSLISSGHVMTAGHCGYISGKKYVKNWKVHIGDHNIKKKDDDLADETLIMKAVVVKHPKFKLTETKLDYDILLLKLEEQLELDQFQHVRPICLPENADLTYFNIDSVTAGWGLTDPFSEKNPNTPYEIRLQTTNKGCRGYRSKKNDFAVTKTQICTDILWVEETPWQGDSGGPLMVEEDGRYIEIGVVSRGLSRKGTQGSKSVAVYTSTAKLLTWILDKIKDDNRCI